MRWLGSALLLALLAAVTALFLSANLGNIALFVPPYRIDLSLNLALIALVLLLAAVYWTARVVQKMVDFPQQVRLYRARREEIGGSQALVETVKNFLEGRFARAEKSARAAQSSSSTAGIAALIGARAAHRMQEYTRRDEWLQSAELDRAIETARLVTGAEMLTEQRQNDAALSAIARLQGEGRRHIHAMRIALSANLQAGRWDDALKAVRLLKKRNALHPIAARKLKHAIYRELIVAQSHDPIALEAMWRLVPETERQLPEIALDAARLFNDSGANLGQLAIGTIVAALQKSPGDWDESARRLIDEYARAQVVPARDQLERVEAWLKLAPQGSIRAALQRAAGVICLREQLWGKSKTYLLESLGAERVPVTLLALAQLADAIGDRAEAAAYFKQAAVAFASASGAAPDSPVTLWRGQRDSAN
ncbi:MAG: heme biosynthesis HemY N-terminal domain-containing protein [Burkholderiaceae bacterium]